MKKLILFLLIAMTGNSYSQNFDIQGHRGCRGILPENSIPAFKKALELGVTTIELDVVVSKDQKIVVSHEPYFSAGICSGPEGKVITDENEKTYNIYQLNYEEIKGFDCGSKGNSRFPEQEKMVVYKPLLEEVIKMSEEYCSEIGRKPPSYNIELKSLEEQYQTYQPVPKKFCDLVFDVIRNLVPVTRITIQSFDHEVLRYWKISYPQYEIALLEGSISNPDKAIRELGFDPDIYSPYYKLLNQKKVRDLFDREIKVIPWTVNEKEDMKELVEWGVNGLITDYPDRFAELYPEKMAQ